jgi:predicted DNA-binding transcriptional regulator AlpA
MWLFLHSSKGVKDMTANASQEEIQSHRLIRLPEVLQLVPIAKSTWWLWVSQEKAPAPIKLGPRVTCWRLSAVLEFIGKEFSIEEDSHV